MNVLMPQLGETVTEGTVANWHKKVGDTVVADEIILDIETDKVSMEIPAPSPSSSLPLPWRSPRSSSTAPISG
jgi:2-oxoglutarate dehydrogenase E2 component (dihydrolipoamide succinyltransferase)